MVHSYHITNSAVPTATSHKNTGIRTQNGFTDHWHHNHQSSSTSTSSPTPEASRHRGIKAYPVSLLLAEDYLSELFHLQGFILRFIVYLVNSNQLQRFLDFAFDPPFCLTSSPTPSASALLSLLFLSTSPTTFSTSPLTPHIATSPPIKSSRDRSSA
jgi:hypothetical protein